MTNSLTSVPMVSILIVNWNGKRWLNKCLTSLLEQTYKNYEIIVIDNGSSDDSVCFMDEHYPMVKVVLSDKNLGFARGNNLGINNFAIGQFILLMNNDTWVEPTFVENLLEELNQRGLDVIGPREANYYSREKRAPYTSKIDFLGHSVYRNKDSGKNDNFYLTGVCLLFKKKLYLETGGLDSNFFMYCEEVDWFWRLNLLGKTFNYSKDTVIYHAGAGSTKKGVNYKIFLWRNQNTLQMLLKNYSWFNLLWVLPLYLSQNLLELIIFLLIGRPRIAQSYILGIWPSIKFCRGIYRKRQEIQKKRLIGDREILRKMVIVPGKLIHLKQMFLG